MSRWGSILKSVFHYGGIAVGLAEGRKMSGKEKAAFALAHVVAAVGLDDLGAEDAGAAAGVAKGTRMVNDGIVMIQNHTVNLSGRAPGSGGPAVKAKKVSGVVSKK